MLFEFSHFQFPLLPAAKRFSMVAGPGRSLSNTMRVDGFDRYSLLRSAAIYGANLAESNLIAGV